MKDPVSTSLPLVLSFPPAAPGSPAEYVTAPFAPLALRAALAQSPPGLIAALFVAGTGACQQPDRGCLALHPDALALLPLLVQISELSTDTVVSAFTRLLDTPWRGRTLGQQLQTFYLTSCPACGRPTSAEAYHWRGHPPALVSRLVRCSACGFDGDARVEAEIGRAHV